MLESNLRGLFSGQAEKLCQPWVGIHHHLRLCRYSSVYCIQCHGASERVYNTVNTLRCVCTVYTWYITKASLLQTKWESHYAT